MALTRRRSRKTEPDWARLRDDELLELRLCDLGVTIEGTWIEDCVERLHDQLADRGLRFRPHVWLSSEWFSPKGVPGIAVPFYLAHRRLRRLELTQMREVEGGTRTECLRILRHEAGHAVQQAYQLHRRPRWQRAFGKSTAAYPDYYRPNPASRHFVQHLRMHYAQSHPDEDFAETFAVWLTSRRSWRQRYAGWPALEKLEYVDEIMDEIRTLATRVKSRRRVDPLSSLTQTLGEHYAERREQYGVELDAYDKDLRSIFGAPGSRLGEPAAVFLNRNRTRLRRTVSRWTGESWLTLDQVLDDMTARCRELGLRAVGKENELRMDFAMVLAIHAVRSHFNERDWVAM